MHESRDVPGAEALALGTAFADQFRSQLLRKPNLKSLAKFGNNPSAHGKRIKATLMGRVISFIIVRLRWVSYR